MASLLFCSYHCIADPSSGAAQATRDLLVLLKERGWRCRALCGPRLDFEDARSLDAALSAEGLALEDRCARWGDDAIRVTHASGYGFPVAVVRTPTQQMPPEPAQVASLLALIRRAMQHDRPDVLLTYGGHWLARAIIGIANEHGVPVVFALHNFSYRRADLFANVDAVLAPSQFTANFYRDTLGIQSVAIPTPLDWRRLQCAAVVPTYVTFVNPQPDKGVFWFARIAHEVSRRRPGTPFLVKAGRASSSWLARSGLDIPNVRYMGMTPDPRDYYAVSRVILMPSLWYESFGRVAAEAMLNGIPVLGSRRGALTETLADGGSLFDIPARYAPASGILPSADEVEPWVQIILRLFDDEAFYSVQRQRCLDAARAWHPDVVGERHDRFFRDVMAHHAPRLTSGAEGLSARVVPPAIPDHVLDDLLAARPQA